MSLITASIIIFMGLVIHAIVNYVSLMVMQKNQNRNQRLMQSIQHQNEIEFANQQRKMFMEAQGQKPSTKTN